MEQYLQTLTFLSMTLFIYRNAENHNISDYEIFLKGGGGRGGKDGLLNVLS